MLSQIGILIISPLIKFFTILVLLRLLLQIARADFYNPLSQFIIKATDPLLKPMRRFIPGFLGFDFPSLILAILVQSLGIFLILLIEGNITTNLTIYLLSGFFSVIQLALQIVFFIILIMVVISWISPKSYHPAILLLRQISDPIMMPFRRAIPSIAGVDFSPMLALFIIQILLNIGVILGLFNSY
tara:strand:+ start:322 stop:879 length:558 start_codon:yes stop_codon:yes gene_type:complete